jgi:hypothetical protein
LKPIRIVLAIILVDIAGITLRYFDLSTYFIFLGFRFHLGSILPFFILFNNDTLKSISLLLRKPHFRKKFLPFMWIVFALIILFVVLYLFKKIKPGDPDYFYEFGLSSIFDFPLYLIWNFPQMCLLFLTLLIFSKQTRFSYLNVFIGLILLFGFETIPLDSDFNLMQVVSLVLMSLIASIFVTRLKNIYWFSIIIFSSVWSIILLFGSRSELLINIFFAREYSSWDGFFKIGKEISSFVVPSFFLIILILIISYLVFHRKKALEKSNTLI